MDLGRYLIFCLIKFPFECRQNHVWGPIFDPSHDHIYKCVLFGNYRSIAGSLDRSPARSIARSIAPSLARSLARSVTRSLDRSLARSIARSLDRSLAARTHHPSSNQSLLHGNEIHRKGSCLAWPELARDTCHVPWRPCILVT